MQATVVTTREELKQIIQLSQQNSRARISEEEKRTEGFITWDYTLELLEKMNEREPHIIVKDDDKVIGYALVALKEERKFHPDLELMIQHLEGLSYNNKKLRDYKYYVMGQICIDKSYRGKGIFPMLYQEHKKIFEKKFDFVITEISTGNKRSMRAHEKVGFKTIYSYRDAMDEWNVVLWDWK